MARVHIALGLFASAALLVATVAAAPTPAAAALGGGKSGPVMKCDQSASAGREGWVSHESLSSNWTVLAKMKGSVDDLADPDEGWYECLAAGVTRGIFQLSDGVVVGMSAQQVHDLVLVEMRKDKAISFIDAAEVIGPDGKKKWVGGSWGRVKDFKRIKDLIVASLYAEGRIPQIGTTAFDAETDGVKPSDAIKAAQKALTEGAAVEVDLQLSPGVGHFATVVAVTRSNEGHLGITIADDPLQNTPGHKTEIRNTLFFPDDGPCYVFSRSQGGKRVEKPNYEIRGLLLEKKTGPKKAKK